MLGLKALAETAGAELPAWETLVTPRLAGRQRVVVVLGRLVPLRSQSPCGFPVCRSVGSVSEPVSSTASLNLPSGASGGGVSLGLFAWARQAVASLCLRQPGRHPCVANPMGPGSAGGLCGPGGSCPYTPLPAWELAFTCAFSSIPELQLGKKGAESSRRRGKRGCRARGVTLG